MFAFAVRRIAQALAVMFVLSIIGFAIQSSLGDPTRNMLAISASQAERQALRDQMGLNDPAFVQWSRFVKNALQGDLGQSSFFHKPAMSVILEKAPATLELVFVAAMIIALISVPCGIYTASRPKSIPSRLIMGGSTIGVSIPVFLTAMILIYIFAVELQWLPSYGRGNPVRLPGGWTTNLTSWSNFRHIILPGLALASIMLPLFIRLIKAEMTECLQSEYVKFAKAKGLSNWRITFVHAFKNTLLPVITVGGVQLGTMIAFTILTESVFQWPGMGFMFIEAVEHSDTPLLVAYMIFVGAIFVCVNTVVDLIYGLVNPTIRVAGKSS